MTIYNSKEAVVATVSTLNDTKELQQKFEERAKAKHEALLKLQNIDDKTKETEGWKAYSYGQPLNKSKCIRVYIDCIANDTPEGFNKLEVDTIIDALDTHIDKCQEFVSTWEIEGEKDDEDVSWNKKNFKQSMQLLSYFTEMKTHIEECQSNMGKTNES